MRLKKLILSLFIASIIFSAYPVLAAGVFAEIPCFKTGQICIDNPEACKCGLCDFLYLFILLANWGMGIMGAVALLAFVAGGVMWLISGGNQNLITKGKAILTGTIKGIIIILCAYLIINTLISTFTGAEGQFYTKPSQLNIWYNVCNIKIK